jgi:DNA-binding transcriptional LysR family regulator
MVQAYRKQFPRVTLRMVDVDTRDLLAQIEAGEIDLAFGRDASSDSVASRRLFSIYLVALIAAGDPLAKRAALEVSDLQRAPLLLTPSGTGSRVLLEQACRADGLTLRDIRMESRAYSGLMAMAQAGCGIAVVLSTVVPSPRTKAVPIHHHGHPLSVWFSGMWHRRRVQPYATGFLKVAEQVARPTYPSDTIQAATRTRK